MITLLTIVSWPLGLLPTIHHCGHGNCIHRFRTDKHSHFNLSDCRMGGISNHLRHRPWIYSSNGKPSSLHLYYSANNLPPSPL
jgi:hypothetical protein